MKQVFFDRNKSVVIKVFPDSVQLAREICGAKNFARFVLVPQIIKLDNIVAKASFLEGFLGYQINEDELSSMIANVFTKIKPKDQKCFSIIEEIDNLLVFFIRDEGATEELLRIKQEVGRVELFPVHGDLQKQNIIIADGELCLIDFEHFMFAPKELELCNSLFFSDGNCLNIEEIVRLLPTGFMDKQMLKSMLKFYGLRQISLGIDKFEAQKKVLSGLDRIDALNMAKFAGRNRL